MTNDEKATSAAAGQPEGFFAPQPNAIHPPPAPQPIAAIDPPEDEDPLAIHPPPDKVQA